MKWKCKDGRELELADMSTDHLKNVITMLRSKGTVTPNEYLSCLAYACSSNTGEYAAMAAEQELDDMQPWIGLELLENELAKGAEND